MRQIDFVILYVESPAKSAGFYEALLGRAPIEASPTFVMFDMPSGLKLGLWSRHNVEPSATPPGGHELAFVVADAASVAATHDEWRRRGLAIAQPPVRMDFGDTFVALDPDGHRLRVFAPAEA
jgi:catechol 2,3-dioxygenase-like lactoylglutathione lyase family enzyme